MKYDFLKKAALASALLASLLLFGAGCDSGVRDIRARCPMDKDSMILPVKFEHAYSGGDFTHFRTESSLAELKAELDAHDFGTATVSTTLYEGVLLLEKRDAGGALHYYCIREDEDGDTYTFTAPMGWIGQERCLIPFWLLDYDGPYYSFEGEPCNTAASLSDFRAFYEKTGQFDIAEGENTLTVAWEKETAASPLTDTTEGKTIALSLTLTLEEGVVSFAVRTEAT